MQSKKAFIKLNGEIGEKEQPCVEYIDKNYLINIENQKEKIQEILSGNKIKIKDNVNQKSKKA